MGIGSIKVTNKRTGSKYKPVAGAVVISIDRTNPILGNPHVLKNSGDPVERKAVISRHLADFTKDKIENGPISQELRRIADLVKSGTCVCLDCWCAPLPCHGNTYKEEIERLAGVPREVFQQDLFAEPEVAKPSLDLQEDSSEGYRNRTIKNAKRATLTIAVAADFTTGGEVLTHRAAGSAYLAIPFKADCFCLEKWHGGILNVAGNGIYTYAKKGISQKEVNLKMLEILKVFHHKAPITQVVCGGQTGADHAGAVAGLALGIPVSVLYPKGYRIRTEAGKDICLSREELERMIVSDMEDLV